MNPESLRARWAAIAGVKYPEPNERPAPASREKGPRKRRLHERYLQNPEKYTREGLIRRSWVNGTVDTDRWCSTAEAAAALGVIPSSLTRIARDNGLERKFVYTQLRDSNFITRRAYYLRAEVARLAAYRAKCARDDARFSKPKTKKITTSKKQNGRNMD